MEIIRLPSIHLMDGRMPVLRMTSQWKATRRKLSQLDHPCVLIQTFLYPLSYAAARLAREKGWQFFVINHGCDIRDAGQYLHSGLFGVGADSCR